MKPLLLIGCMAAGIAVSSCDMMMESADYAPGYTISTGIVPPPSWNPGWNLGYAPVSAPSPHPPGYIPPQLWQPSVNPNPLPVRPAGSGRPVTLPANPATPGSPAVPATPAIPANGNRPGAQLTPPANNNGNVQVTRPVQGRH